MKSGELTGPQMVANREAEVTSTNSIYVFETDDPVRPPPGKRT